jgi:hypothetical protein
MISEMVHRASRFRGSHHFRILWRMISAKQNSVAILKVTIPGLLSSPESRILFHEMRAFTRELPSRLQAPLPETLEQLIGNDKPDRTNYQAEATIRNLADLAVLLDIAPGLGYCLRRSLTRFYFLRRAGVPVVLHFGARHTDKERCGVLDGHAWLTLGADPYHEIHENLDSFAIMLSFPPHETFTPS